MDFYAKNYMTVIEIDGESHDYKGQYDTIRDAYLNSLGLEVLHLQDIAVKKATSEILQSLYTFFENKIKIPIGGSKLPRQSATATPSREGE